MNPNNHCSGNSRSLSPPLGRQTVSAASKRRSARQVKTARKKCLRFTPTPTPTATSQSYSIRALLFADHGMENPHFSRSAPGPGEGEQQPIKLSVLQSHVSAATVLHTRRSRR
ncbi:hypothetical protein WAI453_010976 [Rhynchosporium graminicola]